MQLHQSTWAEVEAYLTRSRGIVIPIGSTEQHGPNGLLGTDAICPEVIAKRAGDAADLLVAPTFNVGVAQHHLGFAGSITLRPTTMIAALLDWIASLQRHGFTQFYFLNGHGGNVATIAAAFAEAYAPYSFKGEPAPFVLRQRNWWDLPGVENLASKLYPRGHGSHATPSEVAVTYAAYPDAVKHVEMHPVIAPLGPIHDAHDFRRRHPDGRAGSDPSMATIEDGEAFIALAAEGVADDARSFFRAKAHAAAAE